MGSYGAMGSSEHLEKSAIDEIAPGAHFATEETEVKFQKLEKFEIFSHEIWKRKSHANGRKSK